MGLVTDLLPSGSWADQLGDAVTGATSDVASSESVQDGAAVINTAQQYPNASPEWLREQGYTEAAEYRAAQLDGPDNPVEAVLDVPADAVNATFGTGNNLGLFGEIDRHLDYRALTGEVDPGSDEWAEPGPNTTGFSGAMAALGGQAGAAGDDAAEAAQQAVFGNRLVLLVVLFGGMYVAGQLFDINLGGAAG